MIIGEFCEIYPPHIDGVGMVVRSYCEELSRAGQTSLYIAPRSADKRYREATESSRRSRRRASRASGTSRWSPRCIPSIMTMFCRRRAAR